ncbi:MAG: cytochrome P450 [Myxococcales bacterium]|nr:cytochrome P450 [Myxococcales bacterium]
MRTPPALRGPPVIGLLPRMYRDAITLFREAARESPDVVRVDFGLLDDVHLVFHPDGVRDALVEGHREVFKELTGLLGDGLAIAASGPEWRRRRRFLQPAFHRRSVDAMASLMRASVLASIDGVWAPAARDGAPIDLVVELKRITMSVILATMFSAEPLADVAGIGESLSTSIEFAARRALSIVKLPLSWPLPRHRRFRAAAAHLHAVAGRIIHERRASGEERGDLLGMMLAAREEGTGAVMDDKMLRDEVTTLVLAGYETTATALTWTLLLLAHEPDIVAALREELDGALGDRDPELADLERLELHRRVIEEALRLYPPVWSLFRKFPEARRVCGYDLPAGGTVVLCPYITHRDPRFWSDPDRFDPDRFDPAQVEARHRYAHFPFGGGPHVCIGATFARVEARMVLAMLLRRFTLEFTSPPPLRPLAQLTLTPRDVPPLRLRPRA